jgi:hypothetical protein
LARFQEQRAGTHVPQSVVSWRHRQPLSSLAAPGQSAHCQKYGGLRSSKLDAPDIEFQQYTKTEHDNFRLLRSSSIASASPSLRQSSSGNSPLPTTAHGWRPSCRCYWRFFVAHPRNLVRAGLVHRALDQILGGGVTELDCKLGGLARCSIKANRFCTVLASLAIVESRARAVKWGSAARYPQNLRMTGNASASTWGWFFLPSEAEFGFCEREAADAAGSGQSRSRSLGRRD